MWSGNPYNQNHLLRIVGAVLCLIGIIVTNFLLFYWQGTDVSIGSRWGVFFVRPVRRWRTWWYHAQQLVCNMAEGEVDADDYEWGSDFSSAYQYIDKNELCETFRKLSTLGLLTCFLTLLLGVGVVAIITRTRFFGDPEFDSHRYYDHCKTAMLLVCLGGTCIIVPALAFLLTFRSSSFGLNAEMKLREGFFVILGSVLSLFLVVFAYMRDRSLLATKFEFEQLRWTDPANIKEQFRHHMQEKMERVEAAKYGGLQSPYQVAREVDAEAADVHGHDKHMITHNILWASQR